MADPDHLVPELMLFARRFVFVWAECVRSLIPVAFLWYKVATPSMDGAPAVIAGIMVVAQWWRPFLSGFLESVELFVFVVQGKGKGKIVVPGSSFWCFTEKYYLPQAWCSIRAGGSYLPSVSMASSGVCSSGSLSGLQARRLP